MDNWTEVVAHRQDVLLQGIDIFDKYLVMSERSNALNQIRIKDQTTQEEHYLDFGEAAYVAYTSTNPEFNTDQLRFIYSSLTTPRSTIDYNMSTKEKEIKKQQEVIGGHNPDELSLIHI